MMKLSDESIQKLADTISDEVFAIISERGQYLDAVMNTMDHAITTIIGDVSPELSAKLGDMIMEKIGIVHTHEPYAKFNIWKTRYEALYRYVKKTYAESYVDGMEYDIQRTYYEDDIT